MRFGFVVLALSLVGCAVPENEEDTVVQRVKLARRKGEPKPVPAPASAPVLSTSTRKDTVASFRDRVLQYRKVYDLKPWLEPFDVAFANGEVANTEHDATVDFRSYSMLAKELIGVGGSRTPGLANDSLASFDISHEFGAQPSTVPQFIRDSTLLGTAFWDWNQYPSGIYFPSGTQQRVRVRATDAIPAAVSDTVFFGVWRGYRIWPKGQISPPQKTYEEYAAEGYEFEPYPMKLTLAVATDGTETPGEILFPEDYVLDGINIRPNVLVQFADQQWGQAQPFVQVKIEPNDGMLMRDYASMPLVGYHLRRTCWNFHEQPLTVHAQTRWSVKTRVKVPGPFHTAVGPIDVVLHGAKLIPPSK